MADRKKIYLGIVGLLFLVCVVYGNHFYNTFHFDDSHTIVDNLHIRSLQNLSSFFTDGTTSSSNSFNQSYRPLVTTSLAVDYKLGNGLNPFYFQLSTFIWFLVQGVLMLMLFSKLLFKVFGDGKTGLLAILAVAWYMLHPAIAETVNYIISRSDVLSTFFVVLAFVMYLYSDFCRKYHLYLLAIVVGTLAKPTAVMFAPMLWLYVLLIENNAPFLSEGRLNTRMLINTFKVTLPAFIACVLLYLFIDKMTPATWIPGGASVFNYAITQPYVILQYFITLFFPFWLSADSDLNAFTSLADIRVWIGLIFLLLLILVMLKTSNTKKWRPVSFGIGWFLLSLIPTSSIIPLAEVTNDHRLFFPFIGLVLSVVVSVSNLLVYFKSNESINKAVIIMVLLCFAGYAYGTFQRNKVWFSEESLWKDVTIKSPGNARGLMNYGVALLQKGKLDSAELYFVRAKNLAPNYANIFINLGAVKAARGQRDSAAYYYQKAVELMPNNAVTYYHFGKHLVEGRQFEQALPILEKGKQFSVAHEGINYSLANVYENLLQWDKLVTLAKERLAVEPDNLIYQQYLQAALSKQKLIDIEVANLEKNSDPAALLDLSLRLFQLARYHESIVAAERALKFNPKYTEAYNNIGVSHKALGNIGLSREALQKALAIQPDFELAKNNLASLAESSGQQVSTLSAESLIDQSLSLFNQGDYEGCIALCRKAIEIRPGYSLAYNNICAAYNQLKNWPKAIAAAKEGLKYDPNNQLLKNNLQHAINSMK